jgi:hypothetical protein
VAVRTQVSWYWRGLSILGLSALVIGIGWLTYDFGLQYAGFDRSEANREQTGLQELNSKMRDENAALRRELAAIERQLQIELATQGNLSTQIRSLAEENALLKEDLAFFQTLMSSGGEPGGISVNRLRVQPDALPGEHRYRMLIVQSKQRVREFRGHMQVIVDFEEDGRSEVVMLPRENENAQAYNLAFKFYQRVEGTFMVPPGAAIKKVQIRVFENGNPTPLTTQTLVIS